MLKVAKSFEYAVLALKHIEENANGSSVTVKEISEKQNIPFELLAKILQKLVKHDFVESIQGKRGGYRLRTSSESILLSHIISALDNEVQLTDCSFENAGSEDCARVNDCCIRNPMVNIQSRINNIFENTTLKEIIN